MQELLTKKEVAQLLRVTTRTVENYVSKALLPPPVKVGGKALWSAQAIADFVAQGAQPQAVLAHEATAADAPGQEC